MIAKNLVIAGEYTGCTVEAVDGLVKILHGKGRNWHVNLIKKNVEHYEVIDESERKSAMSAIGRGLAGSIILGPVGLLAGLSARSKRTILVAVTFKTGKKSLLEIDQNIYGFLVKKLF